MTSKRCCDNIGIKKGIDVKYMKKDERLRFTLRIPKPLFNLVQDKAIYTGVATNALILQILWQWVKENNKDWMVRE